MQKVHLSAATVINKDAHKRSLHANENILKHVLAFYGVCVCDLFSMQYYCYHLRREKTEVITSCG